MCNRKGSSSWSTPPRLTLDRHRASYLHSGPVLSKISASEVRSVIRHASNAHGDCRVTTSAAHVVPSTWYSVLGASYVELERKRCSISTPCVCSGLRTSRGDVLSGFHGGRFGPKPVGRHRTIGHWMTCFSVAGKFTNSLLFAQESPDYFALLRDIQHPIQMPAVSLDDGDLGNAALRLVAFRGPH